MLAFCQMTPAKAEVPPKLQKSGLVFDAGGSGEFEKQSFEFRPSNREGVTLVTRTVHSSPNDAEFDVVQAVQELQVERSNIKSVLLISGSMRGEVPWPRQFVVLKFASPRKISSGTETRKSKVRICEIDTSLNSTDSSPYKSLETLTTHDARIGFSALDDANRFLKSVQLWAQASISRYSAMKGNVFTFGSVLSEEQIEDMSQKPKFHKQNCRELSKDLEFVKLELESSQSKIKFLGGAVNPTFGRSNFYRYMDIFDQKKKVIEHPNGFSIPLITALDMGLEECEKCKPLSSRAKSKGSKKRK